MCNYTLSNCAFCSNGNTCTTCYNGYYLYTYDLTNNYQNCQPCSLPGCLICSSQSVCTQCAYGYLTGGNTCLNLNFSNAGNFNYFTYEGGASTAA